jgi:hypothetical protein
MAIMCPPRHLFWFKTVQRSKELNFSGRKTHQHVANLPRFWMTHIGSCQARDSGTLKAKESKRHGKSGIFIASRAPEMLILRRKICHGVGTSVQVTWTRPAMPFVGAARSLDLGQTAGKSSEGACDVMQQAVLGPSNQSTSPFFIRSRLPDGLLLSHCGVTYYARGVSEKI